VAVSSAGHTGLISCTVSLNHMQTMSKVMKNNEIQERIIVNFV
jgi:hypothetical protein